MKNLFLKEGLEGQMSLEKRKALGFFYAKKMFNTITIRLNLTQWGAKAKDVTYKISFPNFRFLVRFIQKLCGQQLPPHDKDWNMDTDYMFMVLAGNSTTAVFTIPCYLTRHKERIFYPPFEKAVHYLHSISFFPHNPLDPHLRCLQGSQMAGGSIGSNPTKLR